MTRVGVDVGGSWIRVALCVSPPRISRRAQRRRRQDVTLLEALRAVLRGWGLRRCDLLTVGSTGIWRPSQRRALARKLRPLARRVRVLSDIELAWSACLGGRPGVVVISGTGSIAYGRDACGHSARAGGLGPLLGDEGSAFWIGKRWLALQGEEAGLRLAHRPEVVRSVSALARRVQEAAARDVRARSILLDSAAELARLALRAAERLHFKGEVPVSWWGGMLRDARLLGAFRRRLRRLGRRLAPASPLAAPEDVAATGQFV